MRLETLPVDMAETTAQRRSGKKTPVQMFWQFGDDGGIVPRLNIEYELAREQIFEEYGVKTVEELEDELLPDSHSVDRLRLGVFVGEKEDATFYSEAELLASVEGVSQELAEGLIEECRDIPTICERRRRDGDVFLGDLHHGAEVEGREWVDELDAFIDGLSHGDDLERRMKDAGVWVEPDNATAGY